MPHLNAKRIVALAVFVASLAVYSITGSPTVVFWDVGEFIAAAYLLQVPHPPGAPLFLLIGRVFGMIPFTPDIAVRMHFISELASALTVMLTFLIIVRFIQMFRGTAKSVSDQITVFGGAAIGALSLAFGKTFWFNALEAEVYGLSTLSMTLMLWLGLRWYERANWARSDIYLLLVAYIVGLAVGVHLLSILMLFMVLLLIYFRWYEFSVSSFLKFGAAAVAVFAMVYPVVVKEFPSMLDGEFRGIESPIFSYLPHALVLGALYGVWWSIQRKHRKLNVAFLAFLFIVLGYSTYVTVFIRANAQPPMNENDPSTMGRLVSYINRDQYGTSPFIQRRWDPDPEKQQNHQKYTSDFDYFWRYQMVHMYLRYFGWNYIGAAGDVKESGVDWRKLYGIPLFLGLLGAFYHWRRDKSMAFVNTSMFMLMGTILVLYFNMQESQPRERDYFYVGSFLAFSIWIGIGVVGLIDMIREQLKQVEPSVPVAAGTVVLALLFVPANMLRVNFDEGDRRGNYLAWDYSYNLLQSVEQDGILFTNGDNDTFPLWYLQDVEGIRRDVRIVNLSLLNTNWYIKQLKHQQPHGAKKVPISTSDVDIERIGPIPWEERQLELTVGPDVVKQYQGEVPGVSVLDTSVVNRGVISFTLAPTLVFSNIKALRVQDILVYDIIRSSNWERPIYFAMTVSDDGKIGLRDYMHLRGLAFKLTPRRGPFWQNLDTKTIEAHLFTEVETPAKEPQLGYRWRGLQNPEHYFDEDSRRLVMSNYRNLFFTVSEHYIYTSREPEKGIRVLDRMEEVIPRNVIGMDPGMVYRLGVVYSEAGRNDQAATFYREVVSSVEPRQDEYLRDQLTQFNPIIVLFYSYLELAEFDKADGVLKLIGANFAAQPGVQQAVQQLSMQLNIRRAQASADSAAAQK